MNKGMARRYARSAKGTRARGYAPVNYGPNVTVLSAMRQDGVTAAMTIEAATCAEVFQVFLEKVLVPTLRPGDIVVMDNLGTHRMKRVAEIITAAKARLLYLPPYSPDLNPIELCFSKLKTWLRGQGPRTKEALDQALTQGFNRITSQDAKNWFKHCGYGSPSAFPYS